MNYQEFYKNCSEEDQLKLDLLTSEEQEAVEKVLDAIENKARDLLPIIGGLCEYINKEWKNLIYSLPLKGDLIKMEDGCVYEISEFTKDGDFISQPACFRHRKNEVVALYRYNNRDYECIWERDNGGE